LPVNDNKTFNQKTFTMQTPLRSASVSFSPKGGSLKNAAGDPAEKKRFNDDDDDLDDFDEEALDDLDYDSADDYDDDEEEF
jgi:hypothetical protein